MANNLTLNNLSANLLTIGEDLDIINGVVVGSDPDYGMHFAYLEIGDRGQVMVTKINTNFHAIDSEFLYMATEIGKRIKSEQIKEIKKENGHLYYTEDGSIWTQLDGTTWGQITGTIANQTDLMNILNDKAPLDRFEALVSQVTVNESNITKLLSDMTTAKQNISSLQTAVNQHNEDIDEINSTLAVKISSDTIKAFRQKSGDPNNLEFTINGRDWITLLGEQTVVAWGEIVGDIQNQRDLIVLFNDYSTTDEMNAAIKVVSDALNTHTTNTNNPHNVTKEQVGLGNVDNTADMNKPLSTVQQSSVQSLISQATSQMVVSNENKVQFIWTGTLDDYNALDEKDENTFYIIV